MTAPKSRAHQLLLTSLTTVLRWLLKGLGILFRLLLLSWGTLALHYSNLPWPWLRYTLAAAFFIFGVWALFVTRRPRRYSLFAAVYAALLVYWATIRPSHDRPWRPDVAVMPQALIHGDHVHLTGFRHFTYTSRDDFKVRWEERDYDLSHLTSMDFYVSYWAQGPVGHTFVSFNFDNALPLCISIETRPEVGESFDPIASLFKQFELIYVIGDERDIVRVRTDHRREDVFLYRLRIGPAPARRMLGVYLDRINQLAARPEFYHLLSNNCTINIIRYANAAGRIGRFDLRHLLNGFIDSYLFSAGMVDTSLPFEELRRLSQINDTAVAAGDSPEFSTLIRKGLPNPAP